MGKTAKTSFMLIDGMNVEIVRKKIKNMNLSVHPPNGRVRLSVPKGVDEETVRLFAISKLPWIQKQQRRFENREKVSPKEYLSEKNT